ncbi:MAG: hypothetical protein K2K82_05900 [Muribaculaceae bacterium]|nr:hypothetical protein [Muribaculaceae bacterium]
MSRFPLIFPLMILAGCTNKQPQSVPRPQAWPRLTEIPASYRAENGVMVNDSAMVINGETEGWFDIVYPAYNVKINCTMTSVGSPTELREAIDNRLERLERNAAGAPGEMTEFTSDGNWGCLLMTTPAAVATPVQFLATDSISRLFSGTAVFSGKDMKADSVAPAVSVIERDLLYMLKEL